ncbi:MAG TPA: hypothetical protein ENK56_01575, partial [Chloroflexi bacterium]|nr:hypothetical protein [Chloroflexota bacterium]
MKRTVGVGARGSVAAALLESMQAVQRALLEPPGLPPALLVQRIEEWRQMVEDMAEGSAQGAELATLY